MNRVLEAEATLSASLGGQPCLRIGTADETWIVRFESTEAFRRALPTLRSHALRQLFQSLPFARCSVRPSRARILVGDETIAEIIPGKATSKLAQLARLQIPGLQLKSSRILRLLLASAK
jgi:hypothetical protein